MFPSQDSLISNYFQTNIEGCLKCELGDIFLEQEYNQEFNGGPTGSQKILMQSNESNFQIGQQQQQEKQKQTQNIVTRTKTEEKKESIQIQKKNIRKKIILYPGETKNIYKNQQRAFFQFIELNRRELGVINYNELKVIMNNKEIRDGKQKFNELTNHRWGKLFAKIFFGNFLFTYNSIKLNKIDINQVLRFNDDFYQKVIQ